MNKRVGKYNGSCPWTPERFSPPPPQAWWETTETAAWRERLVPWIKAQRQVTVQDIVNMRRAS